MSRFKFVGAAAVDVPAINAVDVQPGQDVEVVDPDVSASMAQQSDIWEHIPEPKSSQAKKAPATRENEVKES